MTQATSQSQEQAIPMNSPTPSTADGDPCPPDTQALLRERSAEVVLLTRELIRLQDALAEAQAELLRHGAPPAGAPALPLGESLPARLAAAEQQAEALRAEIDALRRSTSWRLTAPLRAALDRLRGLRRR